jgi:hypothetical protein
MRHFLFEDREYKINIQFRRRKGERDSAQALARLLRVKNPSRGSGRSGGGSRKVDVRQKCVVKMQYSKSIEAHRVQLEKYLIREGTDIDGGRARLYGTDLEEYRENMVDKNFRVFLSPQNDKTDLTAMTERFVKKLELQTGYKLYWQAANHYNTAHPHAHLLINGKDQNGKDIVFPRDVVKTFMRETARDVCTSLTGIRTREEMAVDREKELDAPRYTRLDEKLKGLCGGTFRVRLDETGKDRERILARLENLKKMKLCVYQDGGYRLSPQWEENLKMNGRYNSFLKARDTLRYTSPSNMKVYSGGQGEVTGVVSKVYRTDGDASDNHVVVLEGIDGKAYFVPLLKKPEVKDGAKKAELGEGDLITIRTHESQQGRLTSTIFKREAKELRKEIRRSGFTGGAAEAVLQGIPEPESRYMRRGV